MAIEANHPVGILKQLNELPDDRVKEELTRAIERAASLIKLNPSSAPVAGPALKRMKAVLRRMNAGESFKDISDDDLIPGADKIPVPT